MKKDAKNGIVWLNGRVLSFDEVSVLAGLYRLPENLRKPLIATIQSGAHTRVAQTRRALGTAVRTR